MSIFPLRKKNNNFVYRSLAPVAVSQILSSLESLVSKDIYQDDNYLRGNLRLKMDPKKRTWLSKVVDLIDSPRTVTFCSLTNICGCSLILASGSRKGMQTIGSALILANNKLISLRSYYGRDGADQMGTLILSYRLATSFIKDRKRSDDLFMKAVNAQACLSYLVPGVAKAFSSTWMQGTALEEILNTRAYGSSPLATQLKKYPRFMKYMTWFTIVWESAFPIIYFIPEKYVPLTLNGIKLFHVGVAFTMGLPRFFWGFMGAHAAVEYVITNKNKTILKGIERVHGE